MFNFQYVLNKNKTKIEGQEKKLTYKYIHYSYLLKIDRLVDCLKSLKLLVQRVFGKWTFKLKNIEIYIPLVCYIIQCWHRKAP